MNKRISIKEAIEISGLSNSYIRKAIAHGKLPVTKELIGDSKIEKNWIDLGDFETWRASSGAHSKREDGRNKFVLYMNADEEAAIQQLLKDSDFITTLQRTNQKVTEAE